MPQQEDTAPSIPPAVSEHGIVSAGHETIFQAISEQMPDALFLLDPDDPERRGKILYANEAACRMHGYTRAEMTALSLADLNDSATLQQMKSRLEKLSVGETLSFEGTHRRKNGSHFPVEVIVRAIRWNGRRVVFTMDRDISDRRQAQEALRLSEYQYRMLFSATERQAQELALVDRVRTVLSKEMDLSVVFKTIVEAVAETFGYTHVAVYLLKEGYLYAQYFVGYGQVASPMAVSTGVVGRVVRTGEPALVEDVARDPDYLAAQEDIVSQVCVPLIDQGEVVGALNVESTDGHTLTEADLTLMLALSDHIGVAIGRARLYSEVRASEVRYRNLVEQLNDVIFTLNPQGVITYISPVIQRYSGYAPEELLGHAFTVLMDQQDGPMLVGRVQQMVTGNAAPFEFQMRTKEGERRWVRSSARVIADQQGIVEVHGILIDLTDRKRMEEERIKLTKLESLGVLAGGIANDFNNLMTGILGNLSMAELSLSPDDPLYKNLKDAEQALMHAKDLTYQLMTFAKGGTPVKAPIALKSVLSEIAAFVHRGMKARCELSIDEALWQINADAGQIVQVFQNVIANADQAMPNGGVIDIKAQNVVIDKRHRPNSFSLPSGPYVRITVTDHGQGIAPEHLPKIFDPYFTTKEEGSGLGLATAYSIISQHGGTITVDSTLGRGTRLTLYFPALAQPQEPEAAAPAIPVPAGTGKPEGRVLVLDDEEMILSLVKQILTKYGYEVVITSDGTETLSSFEQAQQEGRPFDVVVLDLTIPGGKGGKEVIQELRSRDPNIHAIVSSGYYNDPVLANYRQYGFSGMVPKPYRVQELLQIIEKTMHKKPAEDEQAGGRMSQARKPGDIDEQGTV
jgi:PAS domain S-box-containing protein